MNTATSAEPASSPLMNEQLKSAVLASLANGGDGIQGLLKTALSNAGLGTEETALLEMMIDSHTEADAPSFGDAIDGDYTEISTDDDLVDSDLSEELEALRQVNDTLAAALGACELCWGGNEHCPACDGNGVAGSERPDARLFTLLIVPALERMRADKRASSRNTSKRRRR